MEQWELLQQRLLVLVLLEHSGDPVPDEPLTYECLSDFVFFSKLNTLLYNHGCSVDYVK